ncbi:MlaD family protein [Mycobacterium sp. CVI_P3]|uniref:MlaD family protein n=1 Tax=Mycobacterium pinniadriaticum TaxID=2994102 RepID=A0ABT3SE11_9MYCO|nr:MlaD family protein [Mycobacterium pinniadriaticum]MCX2930693.1 MlaD family protein [Mycobacterium pinniadriaticum]MCX2937117.1 MlaD family protein [Mycobacterium pinniadriaticum]
MRLRHLVSFAAFATITCFCVYYIAALGVRVGPPEDRISVSMQVPDVNGLVVDSNVLLRGIPVGKVTGISTALSGATVDFYLTRDVPVPVDSEVRLENLSALGETYIGLVPRSSAGPFFQSGQHVVADNIIAPASISELSVSLARVLSQLKPDSLDHLVGEADAALPDPDVVLPNLARASILLRNAVSGMDGRGSKLLDDFQTLLRNAGFVGPRVAEITPALYALGPEQFGLFINSKHLVDDTGSPEGLRNVGRLMKRVQNFLDARGPDLKVFADALTPNINGIAAAAMNFDTGQILSNMLAAYPEDGVVTLRVKTPPP